MLFRPHGSHLWAVTVGLAALALVPASGDIVISEIMYHPGSDLEWDEYIEITNTGDSVVDVSGWAFDMGVLYTFPSGTEMDPGEPLVIARDADCLASARGLSRVLGDWEGRLSNSGERLRLVNEIETIIDDVEYRDESPWTPRADGSGRSLERIALSEDEDSFLNWAASAHGVEGTPSQPNSIARDELPPVAWDLVWSPETPEPGESVIVRLRVSSETVSGSLVAQIGSDEIWYPLGPGDEIMGALQTTLRRPPNAREPDDDPLPDRTPLPETLRADEEDEDDIWLQAELPALQANTLVRFHAVVTDLRTGLTGVAPEDAPLERRGYFVEPTDPVSPLPTYRLFADQSVLDALEADPLSNVLHPAVLSVEGCLFEPVWIRYRGRALRAFPKKSWKVFLPEWMDWCDQQTFNFNSSYGDKAFIREILCSWLIGLQGYPVSAAEPVRLEINGEYRGLHTLVENVGRRWLDERGFDDSGDLYRSINGNLGSEEVTSIPLLYEKEINPETGFDSLVALIELLDAQPEPWPENLEANVNVDRFLDYFALRIVLSHCDDRFKNFFMYLDPESDLWEYLPWDMDLTWGRFYMDTYLNDEFITDKEIFFNPTHAVMARVTEQPAWRDEIQRRIARILIEDFRPSLVDPVINHWMDLITPDMLEDDAKWATDEEFLASRQQLRDYVLLRRAYLLEQIPPQLIPMTCDRLTDALLGIDPLVANEIIAADINGDGVRDVSDLVALQDAQTSGP
jgi:spore coat protein CotH